MGWTRRAVVAAVGLGLTVGMAPSALADPTAPAFSIVSNSRANVSHFQTFRYDTATATNVTDTAAARINAAVAAIVQRNVREALRASSFRCYGAGRCGVLDATLTQLPCVGGYLCIHQLADEYWPGAGTSGQAVDALVFDPTTGAQVPINEELAPTQRRAFVTSVRAAVKRLQVRNGFYDPIFMSGVKLSAMTHWAPMPDGIHVWFDKYVAGPGAAGIVTVRVPYPADALIKP